MRITSPYKYYSLELKIEDRIRELETKQRYGTISPVEEGVLSELHRLISVLEVEPYAG